MAVQHLQRHPAAREVNVGHAHHSLKAPCAYRSKQYCLPDVVASCSTSRFCEGWRRKAWRWRVIITWEELLRDARLVLIFIAQRDVGDVAPCCPQILGKKLAPTMQHGIQNGEAGELPVLRRDGGRARQRSTQREVFDQLLPGAPRTLLVCAALFSRRVHLKG